MKTNLQKLEIIDLANESTSDNPVEKAKVQGIKDRIINLFRPKKKQTQSTVKAPEQLKVSEQLYVFNKEIISPELLEKFNAEKLNKETEIVTLNGLIAEAEKNIPNFDSAKINKQKDEIIKDIAHLEGCKNILSKDVAEFSKNITEKELYLKTLDSLTDRMTSFNIDNKNYHLVRDALELKKQLATNISIVKSKSNEDIVASKYREVCEGEIKDLKAKLQRKKEEELVMSNKASKLNEKMQEFDRLASQKLQLKGFEKEASEIVAKITKLQKLDIEVIDGQNKKYLATFFKSIAESKDTKNEFIKHKTQIFLTANNISESTLSQLEENAEESWQGWLRVNLKTEIEESFKDKITLSAEVINKLLSSNQEELSEINIKEGSKSVFEDLKVAIKLWNSAKSANDQFLELIDNLQKGISENVDDDNGNGNAPERLYSKERIDELTKALGELKFPEGELFEVDSDIIMKKTAENISFLSTLQEIDDTIRDELAKLASDVVKNINKSVIISGQDIEKVCNTFVVGQFSAEEIIAQNAKINDEKIEEIKQKIKKQLEINNPGALEKLKNLFGFESKVGGVEDTRSQIFDKIFDEIKADKFPNGELPKFLTDTTKNKLNVCNNLFKNTYSVLIDPSTGKIKSGSEFKESEKQISLWIAPSSNPSFFPVFKEAIDGLFKDIQLSTYEKNFLDKFKNIEIFTSEEQQKAITNVIKAFQKDKDITHANFSMGMGGGKTALIRALIELSPNFYSNIDESLFEEIKKMAEATEPSLKAMLNEFKVEKQVDGYYKVNLSPALGQKKIAISFDYGEFKKGDTAENVNNYIIAKIINKIESAPAGKQDLIISLDEFGEIARLSFKNKDGKLFSGYDLVKQSVDQIKEGKFTIGDLKDEALKQRQSLISSKVGKCLSIKTDGTILIDYKIVSKIGKYETKSFSLDKEGLKLDLKDVSSRLGSLYQEFKDVTKDKANKASEGVKIIIDHDLRGLYSSLFLAGGSYFVGFDGEKLGSVDQINKLLDTRDTENKKLLSLLEKDKDVALSKYKNQEAVTERGKLKSFLLKEFESNEDSIICFVAKESENNEIKEKYHLFEMKNSKIFPVVNKINIKGHNVDRLFFTDDQLKGYVEGNASKKIKVVYTQDVARGGNYPVNGGVFANDTMMEIRNFDLNWKSDKIVAELLQNLKRNRGKHNLANLAIKGIVEKDGQGKDIEKDITAEVFGVIKGYQNYIEFMLDDKAKIDNVNDFEKACIDSLTYIKDSSHNFNAPKQDWNEVIKIAGLIKEGILTDENLKALSGDKNNAEAFKKFERNFSAASQIARITKYQDFVGVEEIKEVAEEITKNSAKRKNEKALKLEFLGQKGGDLYSDVTYKLSDKGELEIDYKNLEKQAPNQETLNSKVKQISDEIKKMKGDNSEYLNKYVEKINESKEVKNFSNQDVFYGSIETYLGGFFEADKIETARNLFYKEKDEIYFDWKLVNESLNYKGSENIEEEGSDDKSFEYFLKQLQEVIENDKSVSFSAKSPDLILQIEGKLSEIGGEVNIENARSKASLLQLAKNYSDEISKAVTIGEGNIKIEEDFLSGLVSKKNSIELLSRNIADAKQDEKTILDESMFKSVFFGDKEYKASLLIIEAFRGQKSKKAQTENLVEILKNPGQLSADNKKQAKNLIKTIDNEGLNEFSEKIEELLSTNNIVKFIEQCNELIKNFDQSIEKNSQKITNLTKDLNEKGTELKLQITDSKKVIKDLNKASIDKLKIENENLQKLLPLTNVFDVNKHLLDKKDLEAFLKEFVGEKESSARREKIDFKNSDNDIANNFKNHFKDILHANFSETQEKTFSLQDDFEAQKIVATEEVKKEIENIVLEIEEPTQVCKPKPIVLIPQTQNVNPNIVINEEEKKRTLSDLAVGGNFFGDPLKKISYEGTTGSYGYSYILDREIEGKTLDEVADVITSTRDSKGDQKGDNPHLTHVNGDKINGDKNIILSKSFSLRYDKINGKEQLKFFAINIPKDKMTELKGSCFLRVSADKYIKININEKGGFSIQKLGEEGKSVQLYEGSKDILFTRQSFNKDFTPLNSVKNTKALSDGGVAEILKKLEIRLQTPYINQDIKQQGKDVYKREIVQSINGKGDEKLPSEQSIDRKGREKLSSQKSFEKIGPSNKFSLSSKDFEKLDQSNQTKNK